MRRTPNTSTSATAFAAVPTALAAALLLSSCGYTAPADPSPTRPAQQIEAMLHASAVAWTRGDLDGFLDDYAEDATFVGSSGVIEGRARIREAYLRGYWSGGAPPDGLRFRSLEIRTVGEATAVAVGRYELFDRDTGASTDTGLFSLTLLQDGDRWIIVHDHSSADPPS